MASFATLMLAAAIIFHAFKQGARHMIRPDVQAIIDGINGLEAQIEELKATPGDDGVTQATVDEAVAVAVAAGTAKLDELDAEFNENLAAIEAAFDASPVTPDSGDLPA